MAGTWGFAPGWYMSRLRRLAADCALAALGKRYTCGRNEERQWSVVSGQRSVVSGQWSVKAKTEADSSAALRNDKMGCGMTTKE